MGLSFNRVMLLGTVASEPRGSERGPGSFRMKTTEMARDGSREFYQNTIVDCWGQLKEKAMSLGVGDAVYVEGSLKTSSYEKDGQKVWKTTVSASKLVRASGASEGRGMVNSGASNGSYPPRAHAGMQEASTPAAPAKIIREGDPNGYGF